MSRGDSMSTPGVVGGPSTSNGAGPSSTGAINNTVASSGGIAGLPEFAITTNAVDDGGTGGTSTTDDLLSFAGIVSNGQPHNISSLLLPQIGGTAEGSKGTSLISPMQISPREIFHLTPGGGIGTSSPDRSDQVSCI